MSTSEEVMTAASELSDAEKAANSITKRKNEIISAKDKEIEDLKSKLNTLIKDNEEVGTMGQTVDPEELQSAMQIALDKQRAADSADNARREEEALAKRKKEEEETHEQIAKFAKYTHQNISNAMANDEEYKRIMESPKYKLGGETLMGVIAADPENGNAILKRALSDEEFNKGLLAAEKNGEIEMFVKKKLKTVYSSNPVPKESGVEKMADLSQDSSDAGSTDDWDIINRGLC